MTAALVEPVCHVCGIPADAGYFDSSSIVLAPELHDDEVVLAEYRLHPNYCGVLLYFAQYTDRYAQDPSQVVTPGLQWQIRCNGQPREPYLTFDRIINPWGLLGFPIQLRIEEGGHIELVVRCVSDPDSGGDDVGLLLGTRPGVVGGRLLGRYWYNPIYGAAPGAR